MEEKSLKTLLLEKQKEEAQIREKPIQTQTQKVNLSQLKEKVMQNRQNEDLDTEQTFEVKRQVSQWARRESSSTQIVSKNDINFFGGEKQELPKKEVQEQQAQQTTESVVKMSSVVQTPNYDFIEPLSEEQEKKIFKIEHQEKKKSFSPLLKRLKIVAFALIFGVLGSWTIYNSINLSQVTNEYNLKLGQYLFKLGTLDSTSSANDLFPTYPEEENSASSVAPKSNWFDRLCNFIAGIFGG